MEVALGLEGIVVSQSQLGLVDGDRGWLVYRGHWANELAHNNTFEEVTYLMWNGHLPSPVELREFAQTFAENRSLPLFMTRILDVLPLTTDAMTVLRTAISSMGTEIEWPPTDAQALRVTAMVPSIIGYWNARMRGVVAPPVRSDLSHVAYYLYQLTGQLPESQHVRALEAYLVLTMEHGMNASTFTARVITSTQADMAAALAGALGAMKGPLHGGAPAEVMDMLEQVGQKENAESWLRDALERGARLMGFGHRVYKTRDPRAEALRAVVRTFQGDDEWFDLAVHVEDIAIQLLAEYKPGRKLYTNVEYWAAAVLSAVAIPKTLYTTTFSLSRMVGWTSHILEQASANRLIRPKAQYIGPMPTSHLVSNS